MRNLSVLLVLALLFSGCAYAENRDLNPAAGIETSRIPDYAEITSWVSVPDEPVHDADTFFILPTVNMRETEVGNEDITDARKAARFVKTLGMERGIVTESTDLYAPFYRQMTVASAMDENGIVQRELDTEAVQAYLDVAYGDIRNAWLYYMEHWNRGRPVILFGYSQGAEMVLKLLAEFGQEGPLADQLVAAYAIGIPVRETFLTEHPNLKMARGETDTGIIVSYNPVDERMKRNGMKELSINPLNWRTDGTPAGKEENLGYVTADTNGEITQEIPAYCGAYLDRESGMLVVTDAVNQDELYESTGTLFPAGDYHMVALNLFYRNLQKNVGERIETFMRQKLENPEMEDTALQDVA